MIVTLRPLPRRSASCFIRAVAARPPHCTGVPGCFVSGVSIPIRRTVAAAPVANRTFSVSPSMTDVTRAAALSTFAVVAAGEAAGGVAGGGGGGGGAGVTGAPPAPAPAPAHGHGSDSQATASPSPSSRSGSPG